MLRGMHAAIDALNLQKVSPYTIRCGVECVTLAALFTLCMGVAGQWVSTGTVGGGALDGIRIVFTYRTYIVAGILVISTLHDQVLNNKRGVNMHDTITGAFSPPEQVQTCANHPTSLSEHE
jgi:hypothetical protein